MASTPRDIQQRRLTGIRAAVSLDMTRDLFRDAFRGILRYSQLHGPWVILADPTPSQLIRSKENGPLGVIASIYDPAVMQSYVDRGIPLVNVATAPMCRGCGAIQVDNVAAANQAVDYFLARGYTNYAVISHHRTASMLRHEAFVKRLEALGLMCLEYRAGSPRLQDAYTWEGLNELLQASPKPLAVLATEEFLGWTAVGKCLDLGIAVPEQVALLTIGNDDLISLAADVPMSTITLPGERLGFEAAQLLHKMLQGEAPPAEPILVPPVEVITRQSTDILAIDDPEMAAIVKHIREKACSGLTVMDLLQKFAIDRRKLERRFKALFNRSPYDEILRVRIERARTLLTQSDFKLPDIAEQCGFAHMQNFGRVFRMATGHTPAAFRRQFRHAQNVPRSRAV